MEYLINPIWFYIASVSVGIKIFSLIFIFVFFTLIIFLIFGAEDYRKLSDQEIEIKLKYYCSGYGWNQEKIEEKRLNYMHDNSSKVALPSIKAAAIMLLISVLLAVAVPSSDTIYRMMAASLATEQNYEAVKGEMKDLVTFLTEEINEVKGE